MKTPTTLLDFQAMFPDEEACWKHLRRMRWPRGFVCLRCGHRKSYPVAERRLEQCRACRYQASLTAGTIFHKTRVPLQIWFLGIFFVARHKKAISALQFQRDTGLGSYRTAWLLLHKLRSNLKPRAGFRLRGLVEADETYLGASRERGVVGRRVVGKSIVGIAVEQREHTAGKVRLTVLEGVSFDDLGPFVRGVIDGHDATIRTDGWKGYLPLEAAGVPHDPHTQGKDFARSAKLMPWSHTVFSNLKAWIRGTFHGVSRKHLQRYLDEFAYRFDRRWKEEELFGFVLRRALGGEPFPYHRLVAEQRA